MLVSCDDIGFDVFVVSPGTVAGYWPNTVLSGLKSSPRITIIWHQVGKES